MDKKINIWLWGLAAVLAVVNAAMQRSLLWLVIAVLFGLNALKRYKESQE